MPRYAKPTMHLRVDDRAFDEMVGLFKVTLEEFKIADADVAAIMADLNAHRVHIVFRRGKG
jgi:hypothetical protein